MNSGQLANEVLSICLEAQRRIYEKGRVEYGMEGDTHQRHEDETLEMSLTELEQELLDTINWAAMTILKLRERRGKANNLASWPGSSP
jgi:hypothetical protein